MTSMQTEHHAPRPAGGSRVHRVAGLRTGSMRPSVVPVAATLVDVPGGEVRGGLSTPALAVVLVASFMVVLDFSIVNVALPSIRTALGFGGDTVQWVVTAYAITFGGLLILGGRIADTFGRRELFVIGLLVFAAASLAAGLSGDAILLVAARAIQGLGAAIVAPASLSLITARLSEGPRRTRALGLYGATASIGFVAGQVLGGVLVQYTTWRWIFLVNVPVGVVAALVSRRLLEPDRRRSRSAHLDVTGGLLITAAVAFAVFAVSEGPVLGWLRPDVIGALVVAALAAVGFVAVERTHSDPLINLRLLRRRGLRTAGFLTLLMGAWNAGELVVLSVYLQQTLHDSPVASGLVIAPQGVMGFLTGMFGARLLRRCGMRSLLVVATAAVGAGFLVLSYLPTGGHYSPLFAAVVLVGFGTVGTVFGTTVMAASGMAQSDQGVVGGVVNTTRQVGAAIGVAVLVAIAEGSHASAGTATVGGDRAAMLAAALAGLCGTAVAWFGTRPDALTSPSSRSNRSWPTPQRWPALHPSQSERRSS
jgi:EmrB/QacA subfamily drug resistance transporter